MGKKVPAIIVLAALGSEVVFNENHESAVHQPHVETDLRSPVEIKATANASILPPATGGVINQIGSDTVSAAPMHALRKEAPVQLHIEGGGRDVTDFTLSQLS
jgi:hypothetical protein